MMAINPIHKQKIDSGDLISFDIFDTLLVRNTANPTDVFKIAHEFFNQESSYFITDDFMTSRISAEKNARMSSKNVDVTLDEIYEEIKKECGYGDQLIDELKKYELKAEESLLTKDMSVAGIYEYALSQEKKIAIVSDMYLPRAFIEKVLRKNGINYWDELIISCEDNVGKYCGSAFAMLISRHPDALITHVGDNEWSDIAWSTAFGMQNIHISRNIEEISFEKHPTYRAVLGGERFRASIDESKKSVTDIQFNLTSGIVANYLAGQDREDEDAIGYGLFGPLLTGFVQWVHRVATEKSVDHIYFLARDGAIVQKAYNAYYGDAACSSTYMYGSRRLLNFPNIFDTIGQSELDTLTAADHTLDIAKTLQYFGINPAEDKVKDAFSRVGLSTDQIVQTGPDMERVKAALLMIDKIIFKQAKYERETILRYFDSIGIAKKSNLKILLCDIGWHGSMQKSIGSLTGIDIPGIYFGIHDNHKTHQLGELMMGYFDARTNTPDDKLYATVIDDGIELLEYLFTNPDQASIIGIEADEKQRFRAVEGPHDGELQERDSLRKIQQSAIQFVKDFSTISYGLPRSISTLDKAVAFRVIMQTIQSPSDVSARVFGSVHHSFTMGSVPRYVGRPIRDADYYRRNKNVLQDEYNSAFWKQGFRKNLEAMSIRSDIEF